MKYRSIEKLSRHTYVMTCRWVNKKNMYSYALCLELRVRNQIFNCLISIAF